MDRSADALVRQSAVLVTKCSPDFPEAPNSAPAVIRFRTLPAARAARADEGVPASESFRLRVWAEQWPRAYRVMEFDLRTAKAWGELTARLPKLPVRDSLIAAMTLSRSLTVVTRDLVPFAAAGCKVITPWE